MKRSIFFICFFWTVSTTFAQYKQVDSLLHTLEKAIQNENTEKVKEVSQTLSAHYKKEKEYKKALRYQELYLQQWQGETSEKEMLAYKEKVFFIVSIIELLLILILLYIFLRAYYLSKNKKDTLLEGLKKEMTVQRNKVSVQTTELLQKEEQIERQRLELVQLNQRFEDAVTKIKEQNILLDKHRKSIQKHGKKLLLANEEIYSSYEEIRLQKMVIERKNQDTMDSIIYAQHIQSAMLPEMKQIKAVLPKSFVFFKPRDIVSGDFYWFSSKSHRTVIGAIDCTGHGVPGAFLSMIGNELLNKIVIFKGISDPAKILQQLHLEMRHTLKQKENENEDGMEMALCTIHQVPKGLEDLFGKPRLEFAGARNSLVYIQKEKLYHIKGDKVPIGGYLYQEEHIFTKYIIEIDQPTTFYIFSDGFQDQFGGEERKKFMAPRFRDLLLKIHKEPMEKQKRILEEVSSQWMEQVPQLDDMLVIGLQLSD